MQTGYRVDARGHIVWTLPPVFGEVACCGFVATDGDAPDAACARCAEVYAEQTAPARMTRAEFAALSPDRKSTDLGFPTVLKWVPQFGTCLVAVEFVD